MATPIISILRRNQGYILAVMGVVLIITWVIGPNLLDFVGGGRGSTGRDPVKLPVVQWNKAGTPQFLSEGDLEHLRQEHKSVLEFVHKIAENAVKQGLRPEAPGLDLTPNQRGGITLGLPMDNSEATVVSILLFAERGRELGVRVDQKAMVSYLKGVGGSNIEEGDILDIAKETVSDAAKNGRAISVDSLLSALRKELTAQQTRYMLMFASGVTNVSTGELWDLHKQLNLRYRIEAYPIDVEKLKADFKAADAKPDEIMTLFNQGKDRVPNPDLPEPGFKTPHRIAFGYCTVDYEVFLAIAKKNVPEAKAVERYTKGIAQGEYRKPPKLPATDKPKETPPGETKPSEEKPAEPKKEPEPKPSEPAKEEAKPAEKPAEKDAKPAAEKPAEEKPAKVAVVCQDEPAKETKADNTKKPADEKKPAEEGTKSEPAKTDPAKTPDAATPPGEKTEDPAKTEKKEEKKEEKEVIEHKTYEDVRDEILTELAQAEATQLRNDAVQSAMDELRLYSTKLKQFEETKAAKKEDKLVGVEDPGEFHPVAFANKHKLAFGKTNLVDRHQAANTVLGQNAVLQQGPQGSITFAQGAFFMNAYLYEPHEASSFVGDTKYIYWRIDDQPEQAVELEKDGSLPPTVKAQVEQAWLKQKAFDAAKKRAEELAAKAKGSSLREVVGKKEEAKVALPIPFSRLTTNGLQMIFGGQPEFSQPNGIPMAGKEFMDAVFSLKPGEAGVAFDQPHNVVYAVHVLSDEPSLEIRREMFLNALQRGSMSDLMIFASIEKRSELQSLHSDLEKRFSVKWTRSANLGRSESEEE